MIKREEFVMSKEEYTEVKNTINYDINALHALVYGYIKNTAAPNEDFVRELNECLVHLRRVGQILSSV